MSDKCLTHQQRLRIVDEYYDHDERMKLMAECLVQLISENGAAASVVFFGLVRYAEVGNPHYLDLVVFQCKEADLTVPPAMRDLLAHAAAKRLLGRSYGGAKQAMKNWYKWAAFSKMAELITTQGMEPLEAARQASEAYKGMHKKSTLEQDWWRLTENERETFLSIYQTEPPEISDTERISKLIQSFPPSN